MHASHKSKSGPGPSSSSCFQSILDRSRSDVGLPLPCSFPADMSGGGRERGESRGGIEGGKLLSGHREEEKAHCDWQMTQ